MQLITSAESLSCGVSVSLFFWLSALSIGVRATEKDESRGQAVMVQQ